MPQLCIFATHPIPYHAPVFRTLTQELGVDLEVLYFSDHSLEGGVDPGFGVPVTWDVPLLAGYPHSFVQRDGDLSRPQAIGLPDAEALLREKRPEWVLLLGYMHRFEQQVLVAAKKLGVRVALRAELSDLKPDRSALRGLLREPLLWWLYGQLDAACAIGEHARTHLLARGVPAEKIFFSPYAVDNALFEAQRAALSQEEARAQLGLPPERPILLFSGKLIPRKDPLGLLDAIARSGVADEVGLIMLGDGELRDAVLTRGRAVLGERLCAPGFVNQSQLGPYFRAADLFVLPSRFETWGLVCNEAMLFGLPVIATDQCGCHPDLVLPGETGFVVPAEDPRSLRERIRWLTRHRARCAEMGERARIHVRGYSIRRAAEGIAQAIASLPRPGS